jgi:hypothetical protein
MSGLPIPPVRGDWPDATMDAVAAVECQLAGDYLGLQAVLANADPVGVAASALKLLAELYADTLQATEVVTGIPSEDVSPAAFRRWALAAVRRP